MIITQGIEMHSKKKTCFVSLLYVEYLWWTRWTKFLLDTYPICVFGPF